MKDPKISRGSEAETYSEAETKDRAEAALKRMLATPHKPHKPVEGREAKS